MKQHTSSKPFSIRKRIKTFGRVHFSKDAERTAFFVLTLIMLAAGLLAKMEIW